MMVLGLVIVRRAHWFIQKDSVLGISPRSPPKRPMNSHLWEGDSLLPEDFFKGRLSHSVIGMLFCC